MYRVLERLLRRVSIVVLALPGKGFDHAWRCSCCGRTGNWRPYRCCRCCCHPGLTQGPEVCAGFVSVTEDFFWYVRAKTNLTRDGDIELVCVFLRQELPTKNIIPLSTDHLWIRKCDGCSITF